MAVLTAAPGEVTGQVSKRATQHGGLPFFFQHPGKTAGGAGVAFYRKDFHVAFPNGLALKCFMDGDSFTVHRLAFVQSLNSFLEHRNET